MAHDLSRIAPRLFNTPLLITPVTPSLDSHHSRSRKTNNDLQR